MEKKKPPQKVSSPLEWFLMEVHGSPFSPGTPGLSHPVRKHNRCVTNRHTNVTHIGAHIHVRTVEGTAFRSRLSHTGCETPPRNYWLTNWGKKVILPYMVRERCHRRHCRMTLPQVRSGDWGRRTRWLQPLLWNPPLTLKAPGGSSVHTPRETKFIFLIVFLYFSHT